MFRRRTAAAKTYAVLDDHQLTCPICHHDRFTLRRSLLNTRGLTFLDLDWANRRATTFICERCGHILWFLPRR